ncbi:MAG: sigma 54-interacting transcriptional regulator [Firmicutes bacterium]|nr:sigma 54-interacting transcriptional regulator [Bacillota bacterium]
MKRIEKVEQALHSTYAELGRGVSAGELADRLSMHRANVSSDLNKLCIEGRARKGEGRPVLFYPLGTASGQVAAPASQASVFDDVIGSRGSLVTPIQQAKAAMLYPPFGLHTLILGQTGVGKTMFADLMYRFGKETGRLAIDAPFVSFNCADYAKNPQLLTGQIFGVAKGAFTGADSDQQGLIEKANGGILFLDEVHRLPAEGQEMLFTFIDKGQFRRLGEAGETRTSQVLIISKQSKVQVEIEGSNAIDRVEIIKDNRVVAMIPHTSTWEDTQLKGVIRFKFQLELGWGPDRRIFADIESKRWSGKLITPGKLVSIEKCWSNFGQELTNVTDNSCEFQVTSYKTTATGKWMGPSAVTNEGFIFEIEDDISSHVTLVIDGIKYCYPIVDLLAGSRIVPLLEGARELLKDRYDFTQYYRSDPWWHNSYKFKIHKAAPEIAYKRTISHELDTTGAHLVRLRVWQKNGGVAWSSPIFIDRE